jgi:hypothetical protein
MPQVCSICRHEHQIEIDTALLDGVPLRNIVAEHSGTSATALFRHKRDHLSAKMAKAPAAVVELVKAKAAAEEAEASTLFERLRELNRDTQEILRDARSTQNHVIALQAIGRAEKQLELEARLLGELDESTKIAVGVQVNAAPGQNLDLSRLSPEELQQLRALILKAQPTAAGEAVHQINERKL